MMNCTQCDMTNVSLDGDESLSQQPLSPGENMGDLVLPQLEERIETLKESDPCPPLNVALMDIRRSGSKCQFIEGGFKPEFR
jgi:hypothetical protein